MAAMGLQADRIGPRRVYICAGLSLAYAATLALSLALTAPRAAPPFWPSNAFLAAAFLLLDRRALWACLALCAAATVPLMMLHSSGWQTGALRVAFNLGEGVMAGTLARKVLGPRRLLRSAVGFLRLQVLAVLPAVVAHLLLREVSLRLMMEPGAAMTWRGAFLPHLLGMAAVLPALLLVFERRTRDAQRSDPLSLLMLTVIGLAAYVMFNVLRLPTVFLVAPLLLVAICRLRPRDAVLGNLMIAVACLPNTLAGEGGFALHPQWGLAQRALIYQVVFLCSLIGASVSSFMVAEQARLRRLLTRRAAAARDARRRALAASRSKSEFLATMSHEIRTPMNSILGFTQLLMIDEGVSAPARDRVKIIADAGASLMTVLNDILDLSKVEAGLIDLCLEPVDVVEAATAAARLAREAAAAKGLALRLQIEGVTGRFRTDGQRLRQILLNLLNNAVKFTGTGHVLLSVTCDDARGRLRFEVSDTGIGIDGKVMTRLFSRFSQADSSTTRTFGGTGLGLAISKGLVEQMGGAIGAESRLGEGSTFWFDLPAERVEAGAAAASGAGAPLGALNGRVLLVDDHPMNRLLGETLLHMFGCEVDLVASGAEAVQAASRQAYDAILMDVHMPVMDGLAATRAIKGLEGRAGAVPVIAMSADVMPRNLELCRQAGMVDHVAKPVQMAALHGVLERWLVEQKRRSAA